MYWLQVLYNLYRVSGDKEHLDMARLFDKHVSGRTQVSLVSFQNVAH